MEEGIKDRIIMALVILNVIFLILAVGSCNDNRKQRKLKDQELSTRLDIEKQMADYTKLKTELEVALKTNQQTLEEERVGQEATRKALLQEQLINKSLKEELEKITKLKEALEEDLKEALVEKTSKVKK
jgi:hypothetical protein